MLETADQTLHCDDEKACKLSCGRAPINKKYGATSHNFLWSFVFQISNQVRLAMGRFTQLHNQFLFRKQMREKSLELKGAFFI